MIDNFEKADAFFLSPILNFYKIQWSIEYFPNSTQIF